MFVYNTAAKGFDYRRPMLGLDGIHLKAKYKRILLAATGADVNGSLFRFASIIINVEDDITS